MKKTPKGNVRLAFRGNKVVEAKNMKTGATHTMRRKRRKMARAFA